MSKSRAIVRTDEFGSYEIWFIDVDEGQGRVCIYGPVPNFRVRRLRNHCYTYAARDYYLAKTKPVRPKLAQAVLNLYERGTCSEGEHRLVSRWVK